MYLITLNQIPLKVCLIYIFGDVRVTNDLMYVYGYKKEDLYNFYITRAHKMQ